MKSLHFLKHYAAEKKPVAEKEKPKKEVSDVSRRAAKKEKCIQDAMEKAGWSREEAELNIEKTRDAIGIAYDYYMKYDFCSIPEAQQLQEYKRLINKDKIAFDMRMKRGASVFFIDAVVAGIETMGWDYKTASEDAIQAKKNYNLTYKEYYLNKFWLIPEEKRPQIVAGIMKERELLENLEKAREAYKAATTDRQVAKVMKESGWSEKETLEKIRDAERRTGSSFETYCICRFWELTDEEQQTYFTFGKNLKISEKYSQQHFHERRMAFYKDIFYEKFRKYLGRKCLSTVNLDYDTFADCFSGEQGILYKPRTGQSGHGIEFYTIKSEEDLRKAYEEIETFPFGVVESRLIQHPEMQKYSGKSVNTLRIVTIRTNDPNLGIETSKVHFVYGGMRMGGVCGYVDNLHSGGMIAAIDMETGELITDAADHANTVYEYHPASGARIKGFKIPFFAEAKQLIEEASREMDIEGYFGWDIAITENGPVVIELNNKPGYGCLQTPYVPLKMGMDHIFDKYR